MQDMAPKATWIDAGCRMAVVVRGRDAARFIDSFTTAAVGPLEPGSGTEGFFADAKGQVLALAGILRTDEGVWIDAFPGGPALAEHLERYHIREQLEIVDESAGRASIVVAGPGAAAALAALLGAPVPRGPWGHVRGAIAAVPVAVAAVPWAGAEGCLVQAPAAEKAALVAALAAAGIPEAEPDALERLRIEHGWPAPTDIPPKALPQELAQHTRAISFTKGCYLGQETVARLDALGHVNRRLVGIAATREFARGAIVRGGGADLGMATSVCRSPRAGGWLGLAVVTVKGGGPGARIDVDGTAAQIVALPLAEQPVAESSAAEPPPPSARGGEVVLAAKRFRVVRIAEAGGTGMREVVEHPGSVVVLPLVAPDRVCLVEVVRVAVGTTLLELPAGTLDRDETLAAAAARELAEETGYRAGRITPAGGFWMSPGILRERMHLFVAEDLEPGPQALEPGEQIRTRVVPWAEALAMCRDGRIEDAKTVAGILLYAARRGGYA
ncbi:MAG: NUDIX domain-containing protein [Planctomycetia bacterium]